MRHYRDLAALQKSLSPDVVALNERVLGPKNGPISAFTSDQQANPRHVLENRFLALWVALGGPELAREYRFHPARRWRFDFAEPSVLVAFEVQGGLYAPNSGHRSKAGVTRDAAKLNAAQLLGWEVYFITAADLQNAPFLEQLIAHTQRVPGVVSRTSLHRGERLKGATDRPYARGESELMNLEILDSLATDHPHPEGTRRGEYLTSHQPGGKLKGADRPC